MKRALLLPLLLLTLFLPCGAVRADEEPCDCPNGMPAIDGRPVSGREMHNWLLSNGWRGQPVQFLHFRPATLAPESRGWFARLAAREINTWVFHTLGEVRTLLARHSASVRRADEDGPAVWYAHGPRGSVSPFPTEIVGMRNAWPRRTISSTVCSSSHGWIFA